METIQTINLRFVAGLAFVAVMLLGGLVATITNIAGAEGSKERGFLIRMSCLAWLVLIAFLALMWYLPRPWNYFLLIPYFFHLPIALYKTTLKAQMIREAERINNHGPVVSVQEGETVT